MYVNTYTDMLYPYFELASHKPEHLQKPASSAEAALPLSWTSRSERQL